MCACSTTGSTNTRWPSASSPTSQPHLLPGRARAAVSVGGLRDRAAVRRLRVRALRPDVAYVVTVASDVGQGVVRIGTIDIAGFGSSRGPIGSMTLTIDVIRKGRQRGIRVNTPAAGSLAGGRGVGATRVSKFQHFCQVVGTKADRNGAEFPPLANKPPRGLRPVCKQAPARSGKPFYLLKDSWRGRRDSNPRPPA